MEIWAACHMSRLFLSATDIPFSVEMPLPWGNQMFVPKLSFGWMTVGLVRDCHGHWGPPASGLSRIRRKFAIYRASWPRQEQCRISRGQVLFWEAPGSSIQFELHRAGRQAASSAFYGGIPTGSGALYNPGIAKSSRRDLSRVRPGLALTGALALRRPNPGGWIPTLRCRPGQ